MPVVNSEGNPEEDFVMNKKKKLLVGAASMLLLTATAATASTFAWFTTVRNATVNYSSATIYTNGGNIEVTYVSSLVTTWDAPVTTGNNLSISGAHRITDISGEGVSFYKPIWNAYDTSSADADSIFAIPTLATGDADGYYVDFTLQIARTSTVGMKVYFGSTTDITPVSAAAADAQAVAASRLAVIDGSVTKFMWAPEGDTSYEYLGAGTPGTDTAYTVDGFKLNAITGTGDSDKFYDSAIQNYSTVALADATGNLPCVADLSTETSDVITFRVWIEGTDPDCINDALSGIFNIQLDLYGLAIE